MVRSHPGVTPARLKKARVLVVGDPCLDEYVYGRVETVAKEAPVPALDAERRVFAPGQATNVAANAAALGARVRVVGFAGDDDVRERLTALLAGFGVDGDGLIPELGRRTPYKVKFVARDAQRHGQHLLHCYWQDRRAPGAAAAARLRAAVKAALAAADVLVLSDYGNGTLAPPTVKWLLREARRRGVLTVANGRGDLRGFRGANVVVGNVEELVSLSGRAVAADGVGAAMAAAARRLGVARLVITAGNEGLFYWPAAGRKTARRLPAAAPAVVDVTGAGDTLTAALAVGLGAGLGWDHAVSLSNLAAAVVVGKEGTATATAAEIAAARRGLKSA